MEQPNEIKLNKLKRKHNCFDTIRTVWLSLSLLTLIFLFAATMYHIVTSIIPFSVVFLATIIMVPIFDFINDRFYTKIEDIRKKMEEV